MKLRNLKHIIGGSVLFRARLWAGMNDDMRWHTLDFDGDDPWHDNDDGGPACGQCGAGVNPHDEDECWQCGVEL